MSTFALRVPTAHAGLTIQPNGYCFVICPHDTTLRDLIDRKVRAEHAKLVGTGAFASSLAELVGAVAAMETAPTEVLTQYALAAWERGAFLVLLSVSTAIAVSCVLVLAVATVLALDARRERAASEEPAPAPAHR